MSLPKDDFLKRTQISQTTLEFWIEEEWIVPGGEGPDHTFTEQDIARAQLVRELSHDMGVNAEGIGIVLHLLDQVHSLRQVLADLAAFKAAQSDSDKPDEGD